LSSHDVPTALWLLGGDKERYRLAAVLQFTSTGIPVVYYGEEVGRLGGEWPDNRSDMPWGNRPIRPGAGNARDDSLRADYKRLISIRRAHPALTRGRHVSLAADGDLLVFARRDSLSGDQVVVAINRGHDTATATVEAPEGWGPAEVRDAWNEVQVPVKAGLIEVALRAKSAAIFVSR
jgi:alpha-amylase